MFGPGVHRIGGDGILQLPPGTDRVIIQRGAWVEGRINITRPLQNASDAVQPTPAPIHPRAYTTEGREGPKDRGGSGASGASGGASGTRSETHARGASKIGRPVHVQGHGIMEGSRFTYHGSSAADNLRFVEAQYDRPLMWDGVTLVNPKGHALFAPPNSVLHNYRMLGWLFNEDGLWLGPNCTLRSAYIRTNDDAIRFYAGALDDFHNIPGPQHAGPSANVRVEDVVVSQSFNGAVLQFGWENVGIINASVHGLDVTGAEWYAHTVSDSATPRYSSSNGGGGTSGRNKRSPSFNNSLRRMNGTATGVGRANDAVINIRPPVYDLVMAEHHRNITITGVRIDTPLGCVLGLALLNSTAKPSSTHGITIRDMRLRYPLQWLKTNSTAPAPDGMNFVTATGNDVIDDVHLENVCVGGRAVTGDAAGGWNLVVSGAGAANVSYSSSSQPCATVNTTTRHRP